MKFNKNIKYSFLFVLLFSISSVIGQPNNPKFVIVLDAGHGGKDPGNSYHGFVEKEISLKTTLIVGSILEKEKDFTGTVWKL